jgi:hypothetical protein
MLIKFTYVDSQTRRPMTDEPAAFGPVMPDVPGIAIDFANESEWPCPAPIYYGHCDDGADPLAPGILDVLTQEFFDSAWGKEQTCRVERKKEQVRGQRDWLLSSSDWSQVADAPLSANDRLNWQDYRRELRDVTLQPGFPTEVTWPIAPNNPDYVAVTRIPVRVDMAQMCLALLHYEKLADVEVAISTMPTTAQIVWQREISVRRDHELVLAMQQLFAWTDAQVDELFVLASGL